jgi:chromate transporter
VLLKDLWVLFVSFAKTGAVAYGGGPSMVPVMKAEVIERKKWIETENFMDALAIANTLPGPLVTKLSAAVGYYKAGWRGGIVSMVGIVLPSAAALLVLMGFVALVKGSPVVAGMLKGLRPVVVAMLAYAAWDMAPNALKDYKTVTIGIAALGLMIFTPIHPALIVVAGGLVGMGLKL